MPQFSIRLNHEDLGEIGGPDFFALGAHVISGRDGRAWLSVCGTRVLKNGGTEFVDGLSRQFARGDIVVIEYKSTDNTRPQARPNLQLLHEQSEQLVTELQEIRESFERRGPPPPPPPRSEDPVVFEIEIARGRTTRASLGEAEQLQVTLNLVGDSCILEADALTARSDGTTIGKRWMHRPIESGERVRVAYAA